MMACLASGTASQIRDQLVVNSDAPGVPGPVIRLLDRRLNELAATALTPATSTDMNPEESSVATISNGEIWIPIDALNHTTLMRLDSNGNLLTTIALNHNPVGIMASPLHEMVYALTRIPLLTPGPAYAVTYSGSVSWANPAGLVNFKAGYPFLPVVTSEGNLWIGENTTGACGCKPDFPLLVKLDPSSGNPLLSVVLPATNAPQVTNVHHLAAAVDGSLWVTVQGPGWYLYNVSEAGILHTFTIPSGYNGVTNQIRIDANGDIWGLSSIAEGLGGILRHYDRNDGSLVEQYDLGGLVIGFAFGADGEDIFAVVSAGDATHRRIIRLNRVTGVKSSRIIDPPAVTSGFGPADPTGFVFANVLDQQGDNDRDGATNREETLAGSSPFDELSRPAGPKVYVSFLPVSNAIVLTLKDPDGLVDPQGGLDLASLSLTIANYGNVFGFLLPFATDLQVSPDLTDATLTFGALPLPNNKKWKVEARVADMTGAVGWDWQVTPPGDL
jgi:hypothetical protein